MAERHARKLQRLLHVRTLQLGLVRADEGRAAERVAQESMLRQRIAGLAADVAPTVAPAPAPAIGLQAAASSVGAAILPGLLGLALDHGARWFALGLALLSLLIAGLLRLIGRRAGTAAQVPEGQ